MTEQTMTVAELAALEVHPLARLFPLLTGDAAKGFVARLKEAGRIKEPVTLIVRDGKEQVLDGQNRQAFGPKALAPDSPVPVEIFEGDDAAARDLVLRKNMERRHMKAGQRAIAMLPFMKLGNKEELAKLQDFQPLTQPEAATIAGVSPRTIADAVKIAKRAPEHIAAIKAGELSLHGMALELDRQAAAKKRDAEQRKYEREIAERNAALAAAHASDEFPEIDDEEPPIGPPADPADASDPEAGADIAESPADASSAVPETVAEPESPSEKAPAKKQTAKERRIAESYQATDEFCEWLERQADASGVSTLTIVSWLKIMDMNSAIERLRLYKDETMKAAE